MNDTLQSAEIARLADYKGPARAGWICLAIGVLGALIPFFGWFVVGPMMLVSLILGIIVILKGGTGQGIAIVLCSILVLPILAVLIMGAALIGMAGGL